MATAGVQSDLKMLPLRALLAYAARCARRVQPLYAIDPSHPEAAACTAAIDGAIRLAEDFAAGRDVDDDSLLQAEETTVKALMVANEDGVADEKAAYAANAAYAVIDAVLAALDVPEAEEPSEAARNVVDSATIATDAARAADKNVQRAARLDWEMLHRMHLGRYPDFGEPIDPSEKGILGALFCTQPETAGNNRTARREQARSRRREAVEKQAVGGPAAAPAEPAPPKAKAPIPKAEAPEPAPATREKQKKTESSGPGNVKASGAAKSNKIRSWVEKLRKEQGELESQRASFEAERALLQAELQGFQLARDEFVAERELYRGEQSRQTAAAASADSAELERQRADLNECRGQLDQARGELAAAQKRLAAAEASREHDRGELQSGTEQLEALARERDALQQRIAGLETQLATDPPEVAELRQQYESGLKRFQKEQERIEADRKKFQADWAAFRTEQANFETERRQFQEDTVGTTGKVAELRQEREAAQSEQARLDADRAALQQQREQLQEECETLRRDREQLEARQTQVSRDVEALTRERDEFRDEVARLRSNNEELKRDREQLNDEREQQTHETAGGRQQAAQMHSQLETERLRLDELRRQLESARNDLAAERQQIRDSQRKHQEQFDAIEQERRALLEERANFARRESELHTAAANRRPATEVPPANPSPPLPAEAPDLESSQSGNFRYTGAVPEPESSAPPLRILIQRGKAGGTDLGTLFIELTRLYQRLGGQALCFKIVDCRTRKRAADPHARGAAAADDRSFIEVHLRPSKPPADEHAEFNAGPWDQFRSCLCMCMRLDAGLGESFTNGEPAGNDHPARRLVTEAIGRSYAADAAHRQAVQSGTAAPLKIDSVHQQLQRVEHLLRSLERQRFLGIELTPIVDDESHPAAEPAKRGWLSRLRLRRFFMLSAAVAALLAGVHYWSALRGYLGAEPPSQVTGLTEDR